MKENPFPKDVVEDTRIELRKYLGSQGLGTGAPQPGDIEQIMEIRLLQGLMVAFGDPDPHLCDWLAKGVCGSALRSGDSRERRRSTPGRSNGLITIPPCTCMASGPPTMAR